MQLFITFLAGLFLMVNMVSSDGRALILQKRAVLTNEGKPCVFPFTYRGKTHNECAQGVYGKWCAVEDPNYDTAKKWGYCRKEQKKPTTAEGNNRKKPKKGSVMTEGGAPCVFPFIYLGNEYNECIQGQDKKWCAIVESNFDEGGQWGYCAGMKSSTIMTKNLGPCKLPFTYNGKQYNECIQGHRGKWCAVIDANFDVAGHWDYCVGSTDGKQNPKEDDGNSFKPLGDGVTEKQKKLFVDLHNKYRREVALGKAGQPAAADMTEVVWDDSIAAVAQAWAERCVFVHSTNDYGENLAKVDTIETGMEMWYMEKNEYTYSSDSCSGVCGHYTQVVWADSKKIGCGIAACTKEFGSNAHIVCNYSPAGNYNGEKAYISGKACSKCPKGYSTCNNGLCKA